MRKTTRWSPDTCGCVIDYAWDDQSPEDTRMHQVSTIVTRCAAHAAPMPDAAHFAAVAGENQAKNLGLALIAQAVPDLVELVPLEDGTIVERFKPGQTPTWRFTPARDVVFGLPRGTVLTPTARATLAAVSLAGP